MGRAVPHQDPRDLQVAKNYTERIVTQLAARQYENVAGIVEECQREQMRGKATGPPSDDTAIAETPLCTRWREALETRWGIITVGALKDKMSEWIFQTPNLGTQAVKDIWEVIYGR